MSIILTQTCGIALYARTRPHPKRLSSMYFRRCVLVFYFRAIRSERKHAPAGAQARPRKEKAGTFRGDDSASPRSYRSVGLGIGNDPVLRIEKAAVAHLAEPLGDHFGNRFAVVADHVVHAALRGGRRVRVPHRRGGRRRSVFGVVHPAGRQHGTQQKHGCDPYYALFHAIHSFDLWLSAVV